MSLILRTSPSGWEVRQYYSGPLCRIYCIRPAKGGKVVEYEVKGQINSVKHGNFHTPNPCAHYHLEGVLTDVQIKAFGPMPVALFGLSVHDAVSVPVFGAHRNGRPMTYTGLIVEPGTNLTLTLPDIVARNGLVYTNMECTISDAWFEGDAFGYSVTDTWTQNGRKYTVGPRIIKDSFLDPPTYLTSLPFKVTSFLPMQQHEVDTVRWRGDRCQSQASGVPGDIVADALKDLQTLNINTCTAVPGLINCVRDIKEVIASAEGHVSFKWLNNLYLSMKYGFANTVRDSVELSQAFCYWLSEMMMGFGKYQHTHASGWYDHDDRTCQLMGCDSIETRVTLSMRVSTIDHGLAQLVKLGLDTDVFPELGNIWDVVPYSFVIDWFIPFGDIFDRIDANTYRSTLQLADGTLTYKTTFRNIVPGRWLPRFSGYAPLGHIDMVRYNRSRITEIPPINFALHPGEINPDWIPAGALAAQRLLK